MKYENPEVDEFVNLPSEHPLKDFAILVTAVGIIAIVSFLVLIALAEFATRYIPFEVEQSLFDQINTYTPGEALIPESSNLEVEQYLQTLADRFAQAQALPKNMKVTVHYIEAKEINAFATLGGHILINSALLARCSDENTLAMVLAHEIAHIKHRHPIVALGRGFTISIAMLSLLGLSESQFSNQIVGYFGLATQLVYSRDNEVQADQTALETLQTVYGHVGGADRLFEILADTEGKPLNQLFSTHPLTESRKTNVKTFIENNPPLQAAPVALPFWLPTHGGIEN